MISLRSGLNRVLPRRLSRKIIWGVVVVQLAMMLIFAIDLINRQRKVLYKQSKEEALSLAQSLAINARPDIISNDLNMLSNEVNSLHDFPALDYAMLLSVEGEVMAHTNPALLGTILTDSNSKQLLKATAAIIVYESNKQIDVAVPVTDNYADLIGWARVSLSREHIQEEINGLIKSSVAYLLLALGISTLFAWMIVRKLVGELDVLSKVADKISTGQVTARAKSFSSPEVEKLGQALNKMLDEISSQEALLSTVMENLPVGIWLINEKGEIVSGNTEGKRIWAGVRYIGAEQFGEYKGWFLDTGKKIEPEEWAAAKIMKTGKPVLNEEIEIECFDKTRKIIINSAVPLFDENQRIKGGIIINVDITGLKEKERELLLAQKQIDLTDATMKIAFDQSPIGMALVSTEGKLLEANKEFCLILGYSEEEIAKVSMLDISHPDDMRKEMEYAMKVLRGETDKYKIEKRYYRKDKSEVWTNLTVHLVRHKNGTPLYFISQLEDITERKIADLKLKESEEKFRTLIEKLQIGIIKHRADTSIELFNNAALQLLGLSPEEIIDKTVFDGIWNAVREDGTYFQPEDFPVARAIATGLPQIGIIMGVLRAGSNNRIWLSVDAVPEIAVKGRIDHVVLSFTDISEKIAAAMEANNLNRLYKFISKINELILRDDTRDEIFQQACQTAVEDGGFRMAWVGLYDESSKKVKPFTWAGHEEGYLTSIKITADEEATGQGPTGKSIRFKKYQYCDDIATDPDMRPWRDEALKREYRSSISLPIIVNGKLEALFTLYMSEPYFFSHPQEIELLLKVTSDIAFALDKLRLADLQMKIEKELQASVEMNRAILNAFPDRIFRIREDGMIIEVQAGGKDRLRAISELTGKKISDVIAPDAAEKLLITLHKSLVSRKLVNVEYEIAEHGIRFYFEGRMIALSDNEVLFIARDITETKEANERLEKKVKEVSDLRFALDEGTIVDIADQNGVITHVNDNFCAIAKYTREELVGQNHRMLNSGYHPASFFKELWATVLAGKIWRGEVREKAGDGSFFWLDTTVVPFINVKGRPYQFVSIRKDITDRKLADQKLKESEEKFRSLVEGTPVGVYILDRNGFKYVSPGFERMFGYTEQEMLSSIKVEDLVYPDDREKVLEAIDQKISGEVQNTHYSTRVLRKDGKLLYVDIISSRLIYHGQPTSIGTIFDITDKIEEEKRIDKAVNDAQEKERLQIGMELHDNVKQIMAASLMSLGFAKDSLDGNPGLAAQTIDNVRDYIREAIHELRRLSHQLAPSADTNLPLSEKIKMLADNMNSAKSLDIHINVEDFDEPLHNDIQLAFYRILQEQFSNILKYAKARVAEIVIQRIENAVLLKVKDDGKGFDTSVKKDGIGLENIKRRVNVLGGETKIISSPGQGCEIIVRIPLS
jgi:PAS domain S-box-containing protein